MPHIKRKITVTQLVESGILLALAFVLSFVKIKFAGSITLFSMVPIVILTYKYGMLWGMLCGGIHGILQVLEGGLDVPPVQNAFNFFLLFLLDYLLAWAIMGLAGFLRNVTNKPAVNLALMGAVGVFFRLIMHFLSGVIIWGVYAEGENVFIYSFVMNILSLGPEIIITAIGSCAIGLVPELRKRLVVRT